MTSYADAMIYQRGKQFASQHATSPHTRKCDSCLATFTPTGCRRMSNQINVYDLHRLALARRQKERDCFLNVLERCYCRIRRLNSMYKSHCDFDVPLLVMGKPLFDLQTCVKFMVRNLVGNGYRVEVYPPRRLRIHWGLIPLSAPSPAPSSITTSPEKKTLTTQENECSFSPPATSAPARKRGKNRKKDDADTDVNGSSASAQCRRNVDVLSPVASRKRPEVYSDSVDVGDDAERSIVEKTKPMVDGERGSVGTVIVHADPHVFDRANADRGGRGGMNDDVDVRHCEGKEPSSQQQQRPPEHLDTRRMNAVDPFVMTNPVSTRLTGLAEKQSEADIDRMLEHYRKIREEQDASLRKPLPAHLQPKGATASRNVGNNVGNNGRGDARRGSSVVADQQTTTQPTHKSIAEFQPSGRFSVRA